MVFAVDFKIDLFKRPPESIVGDRLEKCFIYFDNNAVEMKIIIRFGQTRK